MPAIKSARGCPRGGEETPYNNTRIKGGGEEENAAGGRNTSGGMSTEIISGPDSPGVERPAALTGTTFRGEGCSTG